MENELILATWWLLTTDIDQNCPDNGLVPLGTYSNIDFSSKAFCGIHLKTVSQWLDSQHVYVYYIFDFTALWSVANELTFSN